MCWHKGQSAVIVDDQIDQERITKVILYISSLSCNVKRPFLIISTSTGLSTWETEFLNLAPSANLVVYKGTKYVRDNIRALEFDNEDGGSSFQILLSSSDIIIEDLHALRYIQWEAIIIDECHRPRILGQFDNLNILKAETRLLLISGQIKEDRADYIKLLSFLKSGHDELHFSSASISNLKSQLEQYIALKCSSDSSRFIEYWVPAQLSSLQLEQYCSILLSNSLLLCSGQKSNSVDALRDLIISTRKCCNHPYLLNPSLSSLVTGGLPVEEHLDIGIKVSGKLQLLEKILVEAKSRELKVMILYQSSGGSGSIGNILDDVLCQRFGNDCYVRYGRGYIPSKKQAALAAFNDRESGRFVFLIESSACTPSIKLSSVDTIILFDSGLDPQNDLKSLQKMSISSKFKKLPVLRLYSYFTVEEKVLMLAKEGIALDSNMQLISQSTNHSLLKWGASYLFSKLDDLHGSGSSASASDISDHSILSDVIFELSSKLVCDSDGIDCHGQSFISRVQQNGGEYARNISLLGEREMKKLGNETHTFSWSDLLKGRYPHWRFLPVLPQRIRKRVEYFHPSLTESEYENDTISIRRKTASKDNVDPEERKVTKDSVDPKRRKMSEDIVGSKRREFSKSVADPKEILDSNGCKVSEDIVGSKHVKKKWKNKKNRSPGKRRRQLNGVSVINKPIQKLKKPPEMPKSTKLLSKPDISDLCDVLHIPENVKAVAMRLLEYVFEHYNVCCLEASIVQAFEISVCWVAASLLKHEIDRKHSLDLAKQHLNFNCKEEEATYVYDKLQKHEKDFSSCLQNELSVEKNNTHIGSDSLAPELKDLVEEEKQKGFQHPHVLNLVKSPKNEADLSIKSPTSEIDLPRKSPTTVLFSQNQIYTENIHNEPYMAHEIATSQKNPGSFPMEPEADATSMECVPDEGINSINLVAAEVSSLEHWNEVPNSSNDSNYVNHVTGSLERQSPIVSSDITPCDDSFFEGLQIFMNQVIDIDNSMNMSTPSAQLLNVETDPVTCDRTDVPEVTQPYSTVRPVCGESTTSEFSEWPLPYTQLSLADLVAFSQTSQPTSEAPENENFTCAPHDITNPGYMNSDHFQAHYGPFEMPIEMPLDADSLLIEMEQIIKNREEAYKTREEKILQLQSDYTKEYEMLREKYNMLLQNVDTAEGLKNEELETQRNIVSKSMILADIWCRNYSCFYRNLQQNEHIMETSIFDSPYHSYPCSMTPPVYGNFHL
ncbi:ISWI chromatin-remodeling complex ATPase ISW2-like isoform X2 [Vicia villosa]|nr:ISWI chromatin-remodeling complex ATPase ISW2-like isoform X2 [Vicia villosa]